MNTKLDMNGQPVKPRQLVSWHGYRGRVVSTGASGCVVAFNGSKSSETRNLDYNSVQVIKTTGSRK